MSSKSSKNEITYKPFTNKSYIYIHLTLCKQMKNITLLVLLSNTWNHLTLCKQMINSQ